jgi:hypothetical protein
VVIDDYLAEGDSREAFRDMLGSQVIVPWLYEEQTPTDKVKFAVDPGAEPIWQRICQEVRMGCARLSWSDPVNNDRVRLLRGRFAAWAS